MTYEEALAALHGWIGDEVLVSVGATIRPSVVDLSGSLTRASPIGRHLVLQALGREPAEDETFLFELGAADAETNGRLLLTESQFEDAFWQDVAGVRALLIRLSGLDLLIMSMAETRAAQGG